MASTGSCPISAKGLGVECAKGNPLRMPSVAVVAIPGFQFDSYDDFKDEAKVLEAIANEELFPLVKFIDVEDASIDKTTVETSSGDVFTTRDSKRGFMGYMDMTLKQNQLFQDYGNVGWNLFLVDDAGNWEGQTPDGTVVKGYTLSDFDPEPMDRALSPDQKSRTPVTIRFEYNEEMDKQIVVAYSEDIDWNAKLLPEKALEFVTTSNVSISTNTITASFNFVDDRDASLPTVPIRTIVDAEIVLIDQTGATLTPTTDYTVVETSTPGTYTIDATVGAMTSGTLQLTASSTSLYYGAQTTVS